MRSISKTKALLRAIAIDRRGATAIEYSLIAALIAVAAITAMNNMGNTITESFSSTSAVLENR